MSVNKVILVGNVGSDPECKALEGGNYVANFSLATSEKYKNKQGEKVENTEWHRVVTFGKTAEMVEKWIKKGQQLYVEGKLKTRSWDDKDGNKKYTTEVVIDFGGQLRMLGKTNSEGQQTEQPPKQEIPAQPEPLDDLPFNQGFPIIP